MTSRTFAGALLLPLALAAVTFLLATRGRLIVSEDSVFYSSAARSLLRGHAGEADILFSERLARAANDEELPDLHVWPRAAAEPGEEAGAPRNYQPFTAWPSGFPAFVALFFASPLSESAALFVAMLASLALVVVATALLGRAIGGARLGIAAACIVGVSPCLLLYAANRLDSDVLSAALVLVALLGLERFRETGRGRFLVLAGVAAALAANVRYVSLALYPFVVAVAAREWARRRRTVGRVPLGHVFAALAPTPFVMAPQLLENFRRTGFLFGVERLPSERGLATNALDAAKAVASALPITTNALPGPADLGVSLLVTAIGGAFVLSRVRRSVLPLRWAPRGPFAAGFALWHALVIVGARTRILADEVGPRLLLPGLIALTVVLLHEVGRRLRTELRAPAAAVLTLLLATATVADAAGSTTFGFGSPRMQVRALEIRELSASAPGAHLYSDRVIEVHAALERPVHWLPAPQHLAALQERHVGAALLVQHDAGFFPCPSMQRAYEALLENASDEVVRGAWFDLYRLSSSSSRRIPRDVAHVVNACSPR